MPLFFFNLFLRRRSIDVTCIFSLYFHVVNLSYRFFFVSSLIYFSISSPILFPLYFLVFSYLSLFFLYLFTLLISLSEGDGILE